METSIIKNKEGLTLIEILLAVTIFTIFSLGIFYLSLDTLRRDTNTVNSNEALFYAEEGLEAIRNMRDINYLQLSNGDHGLAYSGGIWSFVEAPERVEDFYDRTITIEDVYRDGSGNIDSTGAGTLDPETKKVTSSLSWLQNGVIPKNITISAYISNWTGDDRMDTTCTEFNAGTLTGVVSVAAAAPPADNCSIELDISEVQTEFFTSADIGHHANDIVKDGNYAYVAADDSNDGLAIFNVSDPANPVLVSELDVGHKGASITKNGNYVYIGVQRSSNALRIVNVSNPASPSIAATINIRQPNALAISGNYLFAGLTNGSNSLRVYNITNPASPTLVHSNVINFEIHDIQISGNYAYVGIEDDTTGLRVFNITTPASTSQIATENMGEEVNAIIINGPFAYVGIEDEDESFHVVNIATPSNPAPVSSLDVSGEIVDIAIAGNYAYAAIDDNNSGLASINISNPITPYLVYNADVQGKATSIDSDGSNIYLTTDTNNKGLVIVETTQQALSTTGEFISGIFDTGSTDTRYNFIEWDHVDVPSGSVSVQLRTANTAGNITTATWTGPDGTNATNYTSARTPIVLNANSTGSRYFQYRVNLASDGNNTPLLNDVRINYSP